MENILGTVRLLIVLPFAAILAIIVKVIPGLRNIYFPFLWKQIGESSCKTEIKRVLFADLKDTKAFHGSLWNNSVRILELGIAHGANFPYYPPHASLIGLDLNGRYKGYLMDTLKAYPGIRLKMFLTSPVEDLSVIPNDSMDVVISTETLCGAQDIGKALKEIKRVLVQGGKFYFMEHIETNHDRYINKLQHLIDPILKPVLGCTLISNFGLKLNEAGFYDATSHFKVVEDMPMLMKSHIFGVATK